MGFTKFVEIGRVCQIKRGGHEGKLVVIVDVMNLNRVLVEGVESSTGVGRVVMPVRHLGLTSQKVNILRGVKTSLLHKHITKSGVVQAHQKSSEYQKVARQQRRAALNDMDRFKVMVYKRQLAQKLKNKLH